ncbi:MAG: FAD-dependent monooxygenase [Pseudomonadota bacterium]|nr:FAD-dependent monooxygenase [Pseudomonadota bacterium]
MAAAMPRRVPVVIAGAGPVGLALSGLLGRLGVQSLVVEQASALPQHPQAHYVNARTMEVMKHSLGLDAALAELEAQGWIDAGDVWPPLADSVCPMVKM